MTKPLKISLAQLNPTVGDIEGNKARILSIWQEQDAQCDLLVFPELFLSGYPPEDLILNLTFMLYIHKALDEILERSKNMKSGAIITTPYMVEGEGIYNAALLIEKGEIKETVFKHFLPDYDVFDESRVFHQGAFRDPIMFRGHKIGLIICEDLWYPDLPQRYRGQADYLIAINGSPYDYNKHSLRQQVATLATQDSGLRLIYLNMVGGQDELVFDGHSFIADHNGKIFYEASTFEECIFTVEAQPDKIEVCTPAAENPPATVYAEIYKALCLALRDYVHKNGFKNVVLGLSGGIDSALVAAVAVDALGADHVRCIMLPSAFTSAHSLEDAKGCAQSLRVSYEIIPISDAVKTMESLMPALKGLAHENTQSRLRGVILMAQSNLTGELLLTTGNKSEMAVGYCTLYGDMNGAYNPLKDVYKTIVYKLAAWRNTQSQVIPERILTKAPSAELRDNQTDQDSLPPYDVLDAILNCLIEFDGYDLAQAPELLPAGLPEKIKIAREHPEAVEKVSRLLKNSEFKRFQAAPGPKITRRAFGRDRRYPLTNGYLNKVEI